MQIAQIMGGYSLGGADLLRRAMGKKIVAEMDAQRELFVKGAIENKVDKKQASSIFDLVAKFAGYGFNKSHAAAYALISYQTAWLKANYPVEFLAVSMNLDIHDTDKINIFRQEAVSQGIEILPPNINRSFALFRPERLEDKDELGIRYALGALKNVGTAAMEELVNEREQNGEFKDVFDVMRRASAKAINKRQLENLIRAGAFDTVSDNRRQLYENVETLTRYASVAIAERNSDQTSLFGGADAVAEEPLPKLKECRDWLGQERLMNAFDAIGLYLGEHPMSNYTDVLEKMNIMSFGDMNEKLRDGNSFNKIAGVLTSKRMRSSQRGRFATMILSDPSGMVEVSIYDEDLLSASREILEVGNILLMGAEIRKDEGGMRITAQSVELLEDQLNKRKRAIHIHLEHSNTIQELAKFIPASEKGTACIKLTLEADEKEVDILLPGNYSVNMNTVEEIRALEGVKEVVES